MQKLRGRPAGLSRKICQIANNNMAEAALARRDARRRKILENSHNRLQLIAGKSDSEISKESSNAPINSETTDNSVPNESSNINKCLLNNGVINASEELFSFLPRNHESLALGDGDGTISSHDTAALIPPISATSTPDDIQDAPPLWETIINFKYDIVLLSMLIQLLHRFSLITFEGTYFFLPLISYVASKYFWSPKQPNSNIANLLLLLNGMSANRAQKIMSIIQYVGAFSHDVCIFLFTTICMQSLLLTIDDNLW